MLVVPPFSRRTSKHYQKRAQLSSTFLRNFSNPFGVLRRSGEGGIWTLAPLLTVYTLSRGASSATWVLLHGAGDCRKASRSVLFKEALLFAVHLGLYEKGGLLSMLFCPIFPINTRNSGIHKMLWQDPLKDHNLFGSGGFSGAWKSCFRLRFSSVFRNLRVFSRASATFSV